MKYKQICAIKSIIALIVFTSCILFFSTTLVSGAGEIPADATLEVIQFDAKQGINELVDYVIKWAFRLAGVLAFVMIVYAGFQYLVSGGNTAQQKDAQERIVGAIIGIVLLFAFYIILYTINPDILSGSSETTISSSEESTTDETPAEEITGNLVNIKDMGIPIDNNTFGTSEAYLDSTLANKLNQLKSIKPAWHVHDACTNNALPCLTTENTRPLGDCHYYGTCVDIDSTTGDNKTLITIFNKQGLDVLDEGGWLHIASPEATGSGSYANSGCTTNPCEIRINGVKAYWYKAT